MSDILFYNDREPENEALRLKQLYDSDIDADYVAEPEKLHH